MAEYLVELRLEDGRVVGGTFKALEAIDFPPSGVAPATYPFATVTVDLYGRVTAASAGDLSEVAYLNVAQTWTEQQTLTNGLLFGYAGGQLAANGDIIGARLYDAGYATALSPREGGLLLASTLTVTWGSGALYYSTPDTGLARGSGGVVKVTNGGSGFGSIIAANLSGTNTGDQTITLTGNVTGSGTGSFATTIAAGVVTNAMLAGSIAAAKLVGTDIATVGTITTGTWHGTVVGTLYGGTGLDGSAAANGKLLIGNGSGFTLATLTAGSNVTITNGGGSITIAASGGGGGSPGGSDTQVQFNSGGSSFGGIAALTWDGNNLQFSSGSFVFNFTSGSGLICNEGGDFFVTLLNGSTSAAYFKAVVTGGAAGDYECWLGHFGIASAGIFSGPGGVVHLVTDSFAVDVDTGSVRLPGTSGNTYRWESNTSTPSTQTLLSLPLNVYGAGTITDLLGDPDAWVLVNIGGTNYKLPAYL